MSELPRPPAAGAFQPVADAGAAVGCGGRHSRAGGSLDETARRLSHQELAVAQTLAAEGHRVESRAEGRRGGRHADLSVCGTDVEVKAFDPAAERRRPPSPAGVANKLIDGAGQADHVVLVANGSGLDAATVRRGLARFQEIEQRSSAGRPLPNLSSVRVLGDGYDLTWSRQPARDLGLRRARPQAALEIGR